MHIITDLEAEQRRISRLPLGCDQQGRYPQAAEPTTDVGADDPPRPAMRRWDPLLLVLAFMACLAIFCVLLGLAWARVFQPLFRGILS